MKSLKHKYILLGVLAAFATIMNSCGQERIKSQWSATEKFRSYWNDGKAELTSYTLKQARYGEIHEGEATLIFVVEPFSKSKQVKLDNWQNVADREDALKMNFVKKFDTGIYPYSTMLSTFSSLETGQLIKLSSSIQEWCGQVYMQLNALGDKMNYWGRSYFEAEGDREKEFSSVLTEDELWNQIKLSPKSLPTGSHKIIPSTTFLRFNHHEAQIVDAELRLEERIDPEFSPEPIYIYEINYLKPEQRQLQIYFEPNFPFKILGWKDTYEDIAWNSDRQVLTTTAKLKKSIRLDYWNKNKVKHSSLKELLK